ncbi:MAG TPA: DUF5947 family protein [Streptomyces sp.]|nr:DUF5947 family protein [Streptomyces sp.]
MTSTPQSPTAARLRDLVRRPRPESSGSSARSESEHCDLCAEALPDSHRHMLDVPHSALLCTCRPCSLLFDHSSSGGRHFRLLPERRVPLNGFRIDDMLWLTLGVPVGLAFFVRESASGEVSVGYPSPLGATRAAVDAQVWQEVVGGYPDLVDLADDVEALLVHRSGKAREHWIVPLDECYRLVAVVRTHWRGLSGGAEVWEHIDAFFAGLSESD